MDSDVEDGAECARLYQELLTEAQRAFLDGPDRRSPRWDLDPPQREEYNAPLPYMLAVARYADRAMAARAQKDPSR